jgi:hypothetical protein
MPIPGYTLDQVQSSYRRLLAQYNARQIPWEQFVAQVGQLRAQDPQGIWWTIEPRSGGWLRYDGRQWVPGQPQFSPPPKIPTRREASPLSQPAKPVPAAQPASQRAGLSGLRARVIATPILALVPAVACGGLWFLYTFLGAFKGEGLGGIDFITPIIIIGVPFLFWAFRKPIDSILRPLDPILRPIPMPLRFGIVLATPILLGCACAYLNSYGYGSLRLSSFVSILAAAVLTRKPGVQA